MQTAEGHLWLCMSRGTFVTVHEKTKNTGQFRQFKIQQYKCIEMENKMQKADINFFFIFIFLYKFE